MTESTAGTRPIKVGGRIVGLDIARAFAVVGMVIVNFKITMSAENSGPQWLQGVAALLDGRAAATFVVLAGIGASLGSRRAREGTDSVQRRAAQVTLAKRALFLFVIGWAFFPIWPADILHYYGLYLAIGAIVLFASDRALLALAAAAVAVSFVFIVSFDYFANWNLDTYAYEGITTVPGFLRTGGAAGNARELVEALEITGHFLDRYVLAPQTKTLPGARVRLYERWRREYRRPEERK